LIVAEKLNLAVRSQVGADNLEWSMKLALESKSPDGLFDEGAIEPTFWALGIPIV